MYQRSVIQLDGETEKPTRDIWFKSISAGEYEIDVALYQETGTLAAHQVTTIQVTGGLRD